MTLGSLFDGIGGFPLAAAINGITPVWASEIEDAPISITKRHFPNMEHLGNITKINGAEIIGLFLNGLEKAITSPAEWR